MAVTAETIRLQRELRTLVNDTANQQTRDLVRAWANAWDTIEPELTATLQQLLVTPGAAIPRSTMLHSTRLLAALQTITDQLEQLAADANVRIVGDLRNVLEAAGAAQMSILDSQLPPGYADQVGLTTWGPIDARAVEAIVQRTTQAITSRMAPLTVQTSSLVRRQLIRSVAVGANPRVTARRMVADAESAMNGELGLTRALRIARTETLDAHRAGALLARQQNLDVVTGWMWICELSTRSCQACISEHGSIHPADDPGPDDHVNGMCTAMPITRSWSDLGFAIPEPPSVVPDASTWFAGLSAAEQRKILGPARLEAWQNGRYPMSSWSEVRHNDGWRNSIQPTRAPDAQPSVPLAS